MARQGVTASHDFERGCIARRSRDRRGRACQRIALNAVDDRHSAGRREAQADGTFGEPVHRSHGFGAESITCKACGKTAHCVRADRFGAIDCHAPGTKIEPDDAGIIDFAQAQFVGKVRGCRQGGAVAVYCPEPVLRTRQKPQWRCNDYRHGEVQRSKPGADKSHVMIERKPADKDIGGTHGHCFADRTDIGEQVCVCEHHAFGIGSAAGCVLDERDVVRRKRYRRTGAGCAEFLHGCHAVEAAGQSAYQPPHTTALFSGNEQPGPGV